MDVIISWFVFGLLHLIILTYQDFKNKMWIDSRHNYFMTGLTFGLFVSTGHLNILFLIAVIIITGILFTTLTKWNLLGKGDNQAITWIFFGLNFIGIYWLSYFIGILLAQIILVWIVLKIFKQTKPVPFMFCILTSFLTIGLLLIL